MLAVNESDAGAEDAPRMEGRRTTEKESNKKQRCNEMKANGRGSGAGNAHTDARKPGGFSFCWVSRVRREAPIASERARFAARER